jgi:hypothetical protein
MRIFMINRCFIGPAATPVHLRIRVAAALGVGLGLAPGNESRMAALLARLLAFETETETETAGWYNSGQSAPGIYLSHVCVSLSFRSTGQILHVPRVNP